jgi:hypothetical protein
MDHGQRLLVTMRPSSVFYLILSYLQLCHTVIRKGVLWISQLGKTVMRFISEGMGNEIHNRVL